MTDTGLVQALDYILNRADDASIDVLAEAVVRRRRDLAMFGGADNIPDAGRMAKELSGQVNAGIGAGIEGLKQSVRDMAIRIIREHAPELTDEQVEELIRAWVPNNAGQGPGQRATLPGDALASMVKQFVSFSQGTMSRAEDAGLRKEIGAWPERYWAAFPPVIRLIITDFLKGSITEGEYRSKIEIALEL